LAGSIVERHQVISSNEGAMLREIAEFDRAESWRGEGFLSMRDWLVGRCRMGEARAKTLVTTAKRTEKLPVMAGALAEGRLTLEVVAPLAAVVTRKTDAQLTEEALRWSPKQARRAAAELRGADDKESSKQFAKRGVRFNDERHSIWAQLTADSYAVVKSRLLSHARQHDHPSSSDPDFVGLASRCADSLVALCTGGGSRSARTGGSGNDSGARSNDGHTSMVVHVDLERLLHGDRYGEASIEWCGPISADVARRLACNADITLSYETSGGTVLDQKLLNRDPSPAQRIAVRRRDGGCRFPGCGNRNLTDVHHLDLVSEGGATEMSNLITLCVPHHSRVHELGWTMDGDAQAEVRFISPHGQVLPSTPTRAWKERRE
jgi:hypothetical protein